LIQLRVFFWWLETYDFFHHKREERNQFSTQSFL
jgi:hypothetical protein